MSEYTKKPWKLHHGFSDWGMPCQHDIFVGQDDEPDLLIASVPSITPYCMGASMKDREYAATQKANAQLIVCAVEMAEMLLEIRENIPFVSKGNIKITKLLKKAGVLLTKFRKT